MMIRLRFWITLSVLLVIGFGWLSHDLERESLWLDEGWTLWMIDGPDGARPPVMTDSLLSNARALASSALDSLRATLARVRDDVHPPLYFLVLDVWAMLGGDSVTTVRIFSVFCTMIALAATASAARRLFDNPTGILAIPLLTTLGFTVYYARETRMYALLLALSALALLLHTIHNTRRNWRSGAAYTTILTLMLYTHYASIGLIATLLIYSLIRAVWTPSAGWRALAQSLSPYIVAGLFFLPWLPSAFTQLNIHGAPSGAPLTTSWQTLSDLFAILTSGYPLLAALPFVIGGALWTVKRERSTVLLLILLIVLPLMILLALNAAAPHFYQLRYLIVILPAWALLLAWGLRGLWERMPLLERWQRTIELGRGRGISGWRLARDLTFWIALFVTGWLIYTQLAMYNNFFPARPRWRDAVQAADAQRAPLEPVISNVPPYSPAAHYRQREGIILDLSWRPALTSDAMRDYTEHLSRSPQLWLTMTTDQPATWDAVATLTANGRGVGYRDSVINTIFYRFDVSGGDALEFHFGTDYRFGHLPTMPITVRADQETCIEASLTATAPVSADTAAVIFTSGYNTVVAQWTQPLEPRAVGETFTLTPCAVLPVGEYHARLSILHDGAALPLLERGLYWGDTLFIAAIQAAP